MGEGLPAMRITEPPPTVPVDAAQEGSPRRPGRVLAVVAVVVLVGLAAVVALAALAPDRAAEPAFAPGLRAASSSVPVPVGATFVAAMDPELPDVTVVSAEPRLVQGSAAAAASVVACESSTTPVGDGVARLPDICSRTTAVAGLDLSTLPADTYLLLVVVPLADGPITVDGTAIVYRDGNAVDEQLAGVRVELP